MAERQYSREELQAILARAIERQANGAAHDHLSHAQLLETAKEVGLTQAEIEAAISALDRRRAQDIVVAQMQSQRRKAFQGHLASYVAVNLGLWGIDWATSAMTANQQPGWHWIVAAAWGIGLALHGWRALFADQTTLRQAAERWQRKQQRKLQKQQMKRAIEGAVTQAVTTSVDAYTRMLDPQRQREREKRRRDRDQWP